jgi:hypothetical protein
MSRSKQRANSDPVEVICTVCGGEIVPGDSWCLTQDNSGKGHMRCVYPDTYLKNGAVNSKPRSDSDPAGPSAPLTGPSVAGEAGRAEDSAALSPSPTPREFRPIEQPSILDAAGRGPAVVEPKSTRLGRIAGILSVCAACYALLGPNASVFEEFYEKSRPSGVDPAVYYLTYAMPRAHVLQLTVLLGVALLLAGLSSVLGGRGASRVAVIVAVVCIVLAIAFSFL